MVSVVVAVVMMDGEVSRLGMGWCWVGYDIGRKEHEGWQKTTYFVSLLNQAAFVKS